MSSHYLSWGRVFRYSHEAKKPHWPSELNIGSAKNTPVLAYGLGRSYGDSCLNQNGVLIDMSALSRFISFDPQSGILKCEAGVSLAEVIEVLLPRGWFPPVVPGTKFVTVGGAIANDIHGKNHHTAGTFGRHVRSFELLRSDGKSYHCSPTENAEFYAATIGGLGLTGLIAAVELQLIPLSSAFFDVELIRTKSLEEYFALVEDSDEKFDYTVSWIDATAPKEQLGRGIFMRARSMENARDGLSRYPSKAKQLFSLPFEFPISAINAHTCRWFNTAYYLKLKPGGKNVRQDYDTFFFPLDKVGAWNLAYGKKGFFQYQFVVPNEAYGTVRKILEQFAAFGCGSFLTVLKSFGDLASPGLMSFPMAGPTLTLDVPNEGQRTLKMFERFDRLIEDVGGRVYPAKDARMSPEFFAASFPNLAKFEQYIDPGFSSSFWRRVRGLDGE